MSETLAWSNILFKNDCSSRILGLSSLTFIIVQGIIMDSIVVQGYLYGNAEVTKVFSQVQQFIKKNAENQDLQSCVGCVATRSP